MKLTQGCRWRSNLGLKLANAFGVIYLQCNQADLFCALGSFHRMAQIDHCLLAYAERALTGAIEICYEIEDG